MPKGDWNEGTTIRPLRVEAAWDDSTNQINHIGIGYEIVGPSGVVLSTRGWTWHNPREAQVMKRSGMKMLGEEHRATDEDAQLVIDACNKVLNDLAEMEGCSLAPPKQYTSINIDN